MPVGHERIEDAVIELFAPPRVDFERVTESNRRALDAAFAAQAHALGHMGRIGGSVLDFVRRRLLHDIETAERFGACRTPAEAYRVCHDFVDTAIDEYAAGAAALATLYAEQGREALHDAEREIDEVAIPALNG